MAGKPNLNPLLLIIGKDSERPTTVPITNPRCSAFFREIACTNHLPGSWRIGAPLRGSYRHVRFPEREFHRVTFLGKGGLAFFEPDGAFPVRNRITLRQRDTQWGWNGGEIL